MLGRVLDLLVLELVAGVWYHEFGESVLRYDQTFGLVDASTVDPRVQIHPTVPRIVRVVVLRVVVVRHGRVGDGRSDYRGDVFYRRDIVFGDLRLDVSHRIRRRLITVLELDGGTNRVRIHATPVTQLHNFVDAVHSF